MLKTLRFLLLLTSFYCTSFVGYSTEVATFKTFPANNVLSYQYIRAIVQDDDGFMWFGSHDGLHKFDGYDFLSFRHDNNDASSLSSDMVSCLLIDRSGNLWAATSGGGLNLFRESTQDFIQFSTASVDTPLVDNNVNVLLEDNLGQLWLGTENGISIINMSESKWEVKHIKKELGYARTLASNTIVSLMQTTNNEIWVGTNGGGISVFDVNGRFIRNVNLYSETRSQPISKLIKALFQDKSGSIWVGTADNGLLKLDQGSSEISHFNFQKNAKYGVSSNTIEDIYQDSSGKVWIATDKGISIYEQSTGQFRQMSHSATNPYSLTNNFVLTFFEDNNNLMWIGTFSGVNRWDPNMTTFSQYRSEKYPELAKSLVMSFTQNNKGTLFFSTYNGGIYQLNTKNKDILRTDFNKFFENYRVTALLADENILWVGTRGHGLHRIDFRSNKISSYAHDKDNQNSISANSVTDIIKDSSGNIWVATFHQGFNKLKPDDTFVRYINQNGEGIDNRQPSSNHILQMLEDEQGFIWLATYGGGINRFSPSEESFIHLKNDKGNIKSLSSDLAWILFKDNEKNLWVGTQSAGMNMLSHEKIKVEDFSFEHLSVSDGMKDQTVYGIEQDFQGKIWYSSNNGISQYDPQSSSFKHFGASHGLLALEYNHGSIYKDDNGSLYFGSVKGFTSVSLNKEIQEQAPPKVHITAILKLNEVMIFDTPISELDSLIFDYSDQLISFEYVGLNYADPEATRYKYRLLGSEDEWIDAGKLRRATYTNLPQGDYQLQIIAGNNDNVWSEPYKLNIVMNAAPWNTWWAYLIYALFIASALLLYSRALNRKLVLEQKQKEYLKQQVAEKTEEFLSKNVELEYANKQLEKAATIDKVTGVKSRRYLDIYIEQASQLMNQIHQNLLPVQRSILPRLYVLMVQISEIEKVSNSQLVNLTDLLLYSRNADDLVIRWSEDTFAIIGYEKENNVAELATRLSKRFDNIFDQSTPANMAYSFYPFNREQPMEISWDQVNVIIELGLKLTRESAELSWLGFCSPKEQPFDFMDVLQVKTLKEAQQRITTKTG